MKILSKKSTVLMGGFFLIMGSNSNALNPVFNTPASKKVLNPSAVPGYQSYSATGYQSYPVTGYPQIGSAQMQSGGAGILSAFGNIAGNLITPSNDKTKNKESNQVQVFDYQKLSEKYKKQKEAQKTQENNINELIKQYTQILILCADEAIKNAFKNIGYPDINLMNFKNNPYIDLIIDEVNRPAQNFQPDFIKERITCMISLGTFDQLRKDHNLAKTTDQTVLDNEEKMNQQSKQKEKIAEIQRLLNKKGIYVDQNGKANIDAIKSKLKDKGIQSSKEEVRQFISLLGY